MRMLNSPFKPAALEPDGVRQALRLAALAAFLALIVFRNAFH